MCVTLLVYSITCYDCRADDSTCNVGECTGAVCVKMETANLDNGWFIFKANFGFFSQI